jgi:hypothetical protein
MNANSTRCPYATQGSPGQCSNQSPPDPAQPGRRHLATWLIAAMALALAIVGSSTATAARPTGTRPASCPDATGAMWHIKHYFFQYDSHGVIQGTRLPASGDRYVVNAGSTDCALAHKYLRRLTGETPDRSQSGRHFEGFFIPPGYGCLFHSPNGFICAATLDETNSALARGDNRHLGYCAHLNHRGSFSWTAVTPNPEKHKPR